MNYLSLANNILKLYFFIFGMIIIFLRIDGTADMSAMSWISYFIFATKSQPNEVCIVCNKISRLCF